MKKYEITINDGDEVFPVWYHGNSEHEVLLRLVRDFSDINLTILGVKEIAYTRPSVLNHPGFWIIAFALLLSGIVALSPYL